MGRVTIEKATLAYERATLLYGSFRRDDAANAEIFMDAAAAILADYPDDVIIEATDPRTGIATMEFYDRRTKEHYRLRWPPQPSEIKEACERLMLPIRARGRRESDLKAQLAERARYEAARALAPSADEVAAKVREVRATGVRGALGLTKEQWDAIPNAPTGDGAPNA